FFFQAEDGIRDFHVTGVQTCALPICQFGVGGFRVVRVEVGAGQPQPGQRQVAGVVDRGLGQGVAQVGAGGAGVGGRVEAVVGQRSEERRVGKEWRARWSAEAQEKRAR